nr:uncharacterized mitochondrial protein AtMg00810-like [Tanacetum cinerariifolium]
MNSSEPTPSTRPTKVEVLKELSKVNMVNTSLKKLKYHLASFDVVVKERTTATAITKVDELSEVQNVFHQMEQAVEQHRVESKTFEVKIKKELEEIETINIELDHRVTKLIAENEHLKQNYKQLYDSIKSSRIRSKEQCDDLINQVNLKSAKNSDLNASLQEKVLVIQIVLWYLDSGCSKHMTRDRSQLISFVNKFLGLVQGLPKLKFEKYHLCFACAMDKSKKKSHKPKSEDTNQERLYLLHMDLCGPMRVKSVNRKKYILVIVDDYSRFTWVKYLRSKDEAPDFIIKFLKMIQVRLKVHVRRIETDNGTNFVNQTLREYYEQVGISHETSVARSPQQNGVIERRNRTLIEAARTMLIYARASLFLWAEAVATVCFTQNRSIICLRHGKTPYELLHEKLLDLSFFHVFGALCYPTNDSENLGKLQPKADIAMASDQSSSGPALYEMTPATISSGLVLNPTSSTPFVPPSRTAWDMLFQLLFDELVTPPPSVDHPTPEVIAPIAEVVAPKPAASTGLPSSTTVNQDAPSPKVYVSQPDGFGDPDNPNHVYKLKKALYGLKQALRVWYDMLSSFLISYDFSKGSVDPTMFIRRDGKELLPLQIYVDDIIFVASTLKICDLYAKIMCSKFKMSMMGKISFFLGLQIYQSPRGIFINQSIYALESLKKYGFESCNPMDTPMVEKSKLVEDKEGKAVDPSHYRDMIGTLLYLTASRHDLQFAICMYARYQARPTEKHLHAVKRLFRYLRGTVNRGLWYLKDSSISLTAFVDADHAGCQDTRRSTSGSLQFLGDRLISWLEHIDIRYHFIKKHVENGAIKLYFVNTKYQLADIFTKALGRERIEFLFNKLGMRSFTLETLQQLTDEVDE